MKHELNSNSAIFARVFPITYDNFINLEWQYENLDDFLFSWLVKNWELVTVDEFANLSTVERLTLNEWHVSMYQS